MTADPTPAPPWTPEMPLRADATDEQMLARWEHLYNAWYHTSDQEQNENPLCVSFAREFAPAVATAALANFGNFGVEARRAPLVHAQEPVAFGVVDRATGMLMCDPAGGAAAVTTVIPGQPETHIEAQDALRGLLKSLPGQFKDEGLLPPTDLAIQPLYASPPVAQEPWHGLTVEQMEDTMWAVIQEGKGGAISVGSTADEAVLTLVDKALAYRPSPPVAGAPTRAAIARAIIEYEETEGKPPLRMADWALGMADAVLNLFPSTGAPS